ncbi:hypothetical protein BJV82DRAFT_583317 [Fennellomyces sp. T-0311]|nr:hypothetical protein BJV82DRAFT_583317 [Fennellomyces sp. T-0311]
MQKVYILLDMFDDPNRQLDTYLCSSIFAQARRLATVAVLLCNDTVPIYCDKNKDNQLSRLQKTLFGRHYVQTAITASTLKIKFEAEMDNRSSYKNDLEALPGEDQKTHHYITLYSYVARIPFMPFVTNITGNLEHMNVNIEAPQLLSMKYILHFEEALREW